MDHVSTAIIAALSAAASSAIPELTKKAIADGYDGLKVLLKKKFGSDSDVVESVEKLERKPDSEGHQRVVAEELSAAGADEDADIIDVATALLQQIKTQPGGIYHVQVAQGSYIAQASEGATATVNVTGWKGTKDGSKKDG
ncbi:hypothetical protein BLA50215_03004 [Burkholderia lata]|uniref:hypothetical protein n=1 Tax=Burkholderia lata (strain ATCC 17760 / DSM 23089 / LMG 22485 / NCIMB 9086 / R18194 / 383) TaxID=482957 RepID=UPI001453871D|nr:hypothetical protein [Burkholderia lata]VWD07461.1 hypothetical protein BLA50215_03004 [Burkholderia lata]